MGNWNRFWGYANINEYRSKSLDFVVKWWCNMLHVDKGIVLVLLIMQRFENF